MAARTIRNVRTADLTLVFAVDSRAIALDGTKATRALVEEPLWKATRALVEEPLWKATRALVEEHHRTQYGAEAYAKLEQQGLTCMLAPPEKADWDVAARHAGARLRSEVRALSMHHQQQPPPRGGDAPSPACGKVVINVAGPRASNDPEVYDWVQCVLSAAFAECR